MKHIHLLGLKDYPGEDIQTIIDTAYKFKEILNTYSSDFSNTKTIQ